MSKKVPLESVGTPVSRIRGKLDALTKIRV